MSEVIHKHLAKLDSAILCILGLTIGGITIKAGIDADGQDFANKLKASGVISIIIGIYLIFKNYSPLQQLSTFSSKMLSMMSVCMIFSGALSLVLADIWVYKLNHLDNNVQYAPGYDPIINQGNDPATLRKQARKNDYMSAIQYLAYDPFRLVSAFNGSIQIVLGGLCLINVINELRLSKKNPNLVTVFPSTKSISRNHHF